MPNIWDLFSLENKVFLVAGGARDLGGNMATAMAQAGAHGILILLRPTAASVMHISYMRELP